MKLLALCVLLAGCAARHEPRIVYSTNDSAIIRTERGDYVVWAPGPLSVDALSESLLGCTHRVCLIAPRGVVYSIEVIDGDAEAP